MNFGIIPIDDALGAILAHSFRVPSGRILKGAILSAEDIALFRSAGIETITVARPGPQDVGEDAAALRLAEAIAGDGIILEKAVGGRVNLMARSYGLLTFERDRLDALNTIDESLTLACLPPFSLVEPGQMVGTVKVIPFAVPGTVLQEAERTAGEIRFAINASRALDVGLIQTTLPGFPEKIIEKTSSVTRHRVEGLGGNLVREDICDHQTTDLAGVIATQIAAGVEMILIVGASALTDRRDVVPAAIDQASGRVEHLGIPVDPGNLLLLGRVGSVPVVGVPGCARSPRPNGFDWILQRLFCGLSISAADFAAMGVGGLLKEITGRPMPRAAIANVDPDRELRIYGLVLAAGADSGTARLSNRMANVADVVETAMASACTGVYVVTGADEQRVSAALGDYDVSFTYNPNFEDGLAMSLRRGLSALPADADGVVVCLGNEAAPNRAVINDLIAAFDPRQGRNLCVPMRGGRRVTPMLIGRRFFAQLHELEGATGARYLVDAYPSEVTEVVIGQVSGPTDIAARANAK